MTNKEYLASIIGFAASANLLDGALIDAEITGSDTYERASSLDLKRAAISVLTVLLSTPDITQGTGDTSHGVRYDRNAILKRISDLKFEVNPTTGPTISAPKVW